MYYELLQIADDTMFICNGNLDSLWTVKALLYGFKLALGLCVNLNKIKVLVSTCQGIC